jgi:peptidoglycan hydrolase-like protein with peptidoglycan-binding domain
MPRHACEDRPSRYLIDKALDASIRELEPVTLLGLKCEIISSQSSYLKSVSHEFENRRIGLDDAVARVAVLDLRTWYDYGDSASSRFVMLDIDGAMMRLGCLTTSDDNKVVLEADAVAVAVAVAVASVTPVDLSMTGQEIIDALPVSVQLRLFAQLVQAVIADSKDACVASGDNYATYIGNPGALLNFAGEDLGLLRLLRDSGHIDVDLLAKLNWNRYVRMVVDKSRNSGADKKRRTLDRVNKSSISVPLEYMRVDNGGWLLRTNWNQTVRQHEEAEGAIARVTAEMVDNRENAFTTPTGIAYMEYESVTPAMPLAAVRAIRDAG